MQHVPDLHAEAAGHQFHGVLRKSDDWLAESIREESLWVGRVGTRRTCCTHPTNALQHKSNEMGAAVVDFEEANRIVAGTAAMLGNV